LLYRNSQKLFFSLFFVVLLCALEARAQVAQPGPPVAPPADTLRVEPARRQAPQVVTVVHRLNGIKALALLRRNGETVATVDDNLVTARDAVTSITAGFIVGDGQNIIARLPQAEAAMEALMTPPPQMSWSFSTQTPTPGATQGLIPGYAPIAQPAEFVIVESGGKQFTAKYVGLDSGSGLSLLRINGLKIPLARDANDEQLAVGQTVRLFAPVRVTREPDAAQRTVTLRVGEIEAKITDIKLTSTGKIAHLTVTAQKLSPAIVGGIALNEAGETIGIVEASDATKARLIPVSSVRRATERVLARRASVPSPWLGVRGEAVGATPLQTFFSTGWTETEVTTLKGHYQGILLTSVAPGTPAALADLRPGDVIVRVNNFEVKTPEDFSFVLNEAGGGATVNFTFFRGQWKAASGAPALTTITPPAPTAPPAVYAPVTPMPRVEAAAPPPAKMQPYIASVKLGESLDPARKMRMAEAYGAAVFQGQNALPAVARGLEAVMLSSRAAAHLGARNGLLVVFIDPESAPARAGLRVFDVIETMDGKPLGKTTWAGALPPGNPHTLTLGIVRDRRKVEIKIQRQDLQK
jgi:S1-C subfamily serine protease